MYFAQYARHLNGPMMDGYDRQDSWIHALFGLLVLLVIAGVAIYLIRTISETHRSASKEVRDPLDIAKERFAKGEISKEELADIKKELK
jgi:putative membrane protein